MGPKNLAHKKKDRPYQIVYLPSSAHYSTGVGKHISIQGRYVFRSGQSKGKSKAKGEKAKRLRVSQGSGTSGISADPVCPLYRVISAVPGIVDLCHCLCLKHSFISPSLTSAPLLEYIREYIYIYIYLFLCSHYNTATRFSHL
jgi:hypothetical protein